MSEKKEPKKLCPLRFAVMGSPGCLGPKCALWVSLQKDAPQPAWKFVYDGCGLVHAIPWVPVKRVVKAEVTKKNE